MATQQIEAESWWTREIVTPELDWLADELCRRTGRPRTAAGTKGNVAHRRGSHRSQEWILRSAYCTNRTYTVQPGLTGEQARYVAGLDFTPGVWGSVENRRLMVEQTGRLMDAMRAGQLDGVRELYGTLDGRTVTGWHNTADRTATADDSHLDHWHLGLDRRRLQDRALMERILAVALGEDDEMYEQTDRDRDWATTNRAAALLAGTDARYSIGGRDRVEPNALMAGVTATASAVTALRTDLATLTSVVQEIAARPAPGAVVISDEQLERVLRRVLGSVDGAVPPAPAS